MMTWTNTFGIHPLFLKLNYWTTRLKIIIFCYCKIVGLLTVFTLVGLCVLMLLSFAIHLNIIKLTKTGYVIFWNLDMHVFFLANIFNFFNFYNHLMMHILHILLVYQKVVSSAQKKRGREGGDVVWVYVIRVSIWMGFLSRKCPQVS